MADFSQPGRDINDKIFLDDLNAANPGADFTQVLILNNDGPSYTPTPTPFNDTVAQGSVGDLVGASTGGDKTMSDSDKRLNIIRSRASRALYQSGGKSASTYTSDRGPITTMKLLKNKDFDPSKLIPTDQAADVSSLNAGTFVNFFVTGFNTTFTEKTQIMQTFGDNEVVYYFGKQPVIMTIQGLLFDSYENDWFVSFITLYRNLLRGTQLAKNFGLIELTLPNMVVRGTISELGVGQSSDRDTDIPFSMQFIVKDLIPLPARMPSGVAGANIGTLVDWSANRQGVQGYSLSTGSLGGGFLDPVTSIIGDINSALSPLAGIGSSVNGALNSFRTSIFTPVFGVISSITKIVKSVTGSITSIISSFTNPINQILRDITSISTQATGLALLVESSINNVVNIPLRTVTNFNNTIASLKNTAGTISRMPENISQTLQRLSATGRIKRGAAILSSGKNRNKSKAAVLSSGAPYSPNQSNTI